jgi:diguanylate cyclase (GGDEF)-like protein
MTSVFDVTNFLMAHVVRAYEVGAQQSTHDLLTGIYNRRGLFEVGVSLINNLSPGCSVAVYLADLDKFKSINDTHGHAAGDIALKDMAEALAETADGESIVARLSGDEFVKLQTFKDGQTSAQVEQELQYHDKILNTKLDKRVVKINDDLHLRYGVSLGRSNIYSADELRNGSDSLDQLLAEADAAMYKRKGTRKTHVRQRP